MKYVDKVSGCLQLAKDELVEQGGIYYEEDLFLTLKSPVIWRRALCDSCMCAWGFLAFENRYVDKVQD